MTGLGQATDRRDRGLAVLDFTSKSQSWIPHIGHDTIYTGPYLQPTPDNLTVLFGSV